MTCERSNLQDELLEELNELEQQALDERLGAAEPVPNVQLKENRK